MTIAIDIRALAGGLQGGIQEYILQLLPELVNLDRSIKFKLFFNAHRQRISAQSQWLKQSNVELVQTNLSNQWLMARTGWFARPFLDELAGGADVWFSPHFFPVALSKCCHLVTTFHDLSWVRHPEFFSWRQRLWHHWLVDPHTLAQRAKQIIAVSHSTRSDLVELYKLPAEKISMIHSGIGADFFQPVSAVELVAVQKKYKLPNNPDIPIIVMTSRVAEQKGIDILLPILPILLTKELQFIIVGDANNYYAKKLRSLMKKFPDKMFWGPFDYKNDFETMLYAGGDIVLLPSRFEPCGIVQLKGLRYGCVPVVREIGGLGETVSNYDPINDANGIGFVFRAYNSFSLNFALARALETYKYKDVWKNMVIRGMRASFSWDLPAKKYLILFRLAIKFKKEDDNVK